MTRVKLEKTKSTKLAYIEHVGAYDKIPFRAYIEKLYSWAKQTCPTGFLPDGNLPRRSRKHDGRDLPKPDRDTHIRECKAGRGIRIKQLAPMNVASTSHKGPSEEYPKTYRNLIDWIINHGYEWAGPPIEIYTRKPKMVQGETIVYAKVEAPVRKLVGCGKERENQKLAS